LRRFLKLSGLLFFGVGLSQAAAIHSLADPALAGASIVDFTGTTEGSYPSLTIGNITFSGFGNSGNIKISSLLAGSFNTTGGYLDNDSGLGYGVLLVFSNAVSGLGFHYGGADYPFSVSAYSDTSQAHLIETDSFAVNNPANNGNDGTVAGVSSASANIYSVLITPQSGDWVFFDDFATTSSGSNSSAPEPSGFLLIVAGLAVLSMLGHRKRSSQSISFALLPSASASAARR
jgi:hypothetical protein